MGAVGDQTQRMHLITHGEPAAEVALEDDPQDRPSGQEERAHWTNPLLLERHAWHVLCHLLVPGELIVWHAVIRPGCSD